MVDQYGLTITITGGGDSPWVFTRSDGLVVQRDGDMSQAAASASALVTFDGLAPAGWSPPTQPDVNSFVKAVVASSVANAVKAYATANLYALTVAIEVGNTDQIAAMWALCVSEYSVSSDDQATVAALATEYGIPGITA